VTAICQELIALVEANADEETAEAEEEGQSGAASGREPRRSRSPGIPSSSAQRPEGGA
jgi:hypothetical protein